MGYLWITVMDMNGLESPNRVADEGNCQGGQGQVWPVGWLNTLGFHQTWRAGKWTIEIGDFPSYKPPCIGDFPASHV